MDWINELRKNSDAALKQIYSDYREEAIAWLQKKFSMTEDNSKEVFQSAIVILYDNVNSGKLTELTSSIKTYLFAIARNKALELTRSNIRNVGEIGLPILKEHILESKHDKEILEDRIDALSSALRRIGDPCRSILQLFYYKKFEMEVITKMMGYKNAATTKNLKYKCIKRLQTQFLA